MVLLYFNDHFTIHFYGLICHATTYTLSIQYTYIQYTQYSLSPVVLPHKRTTYWNTHCCTYTLSIQYTYIQYTQNSLSPVVLPHKRTTYWNTHYCTYTLSINTHTFHIHNIHCPRWFYHTKEQHTGTLTAVHCN